VEGEFRGQPEQRRNKALPAFGWGRRGDFFPAGQADGEVRSERIHSLFHGLAMIFAVGGNAGQIDKLNQNLAVAAGGDLRGMKVAGDIPAPCKLSHSALELRAFPFSSVGHLCPRIKRSPRLRRSEGDEEPSTVFSSN
jgi:hypothetical protein